MKISKKHFPWVGPIAVILLLLSCSGRSYFSLDIDALSFIPKDTRSYEWAKDSSPVYHLYLFPYLPEPVDSSTTVEREITRGVAVDFPVPDYPKEGELELIFSVESTVHNKSTGPLGPIRVSLFIGEEGVEDVFNTNEGAVEALEIEIASLPAGEKRRLDGVKKLKPGDPGFDILAGGSARLGIRAHFAAPVNAIDVLYQLELLHVKIRTRPFSFLP